MSDELLTPQERQDFREWEKGFESTFWRKLAEDLESELEQAPAHLFWACKSQDELVAARARLQAIAQLLSYPEMIRQKKENLIQSRAFEKEEAADNDSVEYL